MFAILNALRALRGESGGASPSSPTSGIGSGSSIGVRAGDAAPADRRGPPRRDVPDETREELEAVRHFFLERLPEHEEEEEAIVYPVVAAAMGGEDPLSSMNRAHLEIAHLGRLFQQLLDELPAEVPARTI